jgi:hypothetical protein
MKKKYKITSNSIKADTIIVGLKLKLKSKLLNNFL